MKPKILPIAAVGLLLLTAGTSRAQEWTFGPKLNLGLTLRPSISRTEGNDLSITTIGGPLGDSRTGGIGAFARYDRPRWYGQFESNFLVSEEIKYAIDGKIDINGTQQRLNFSPSGGSRNRLDARLLGGYKPLPWLRVYAGLGVTQYTRSQISYHFQIEEAQRNAERFPNDRPLFLVGIHAYNVAEALEERGVRRTGLEGTLGAGVDVGGLTVDLSIQQGLTPLIGSFTEGEQTYNVQHRSRFLTLQLGYRLFPLKAHALAPRKNRAYERIKQDIPFYRNEFHVAGGLLAEDIGSAFLYENRYTRYLSRRFGLTAGLNLMRAYETYDSGFLLKQSTQTQLLMGIRFLPLYSRRHTIGVSFGPILTYKTGFSTYSGGNRTINGTPTTAVNLDRNSRIDQLSLGTYYAVDYNIAATDRIVLGPWLRVASSRGYFGVQAGYRF